MKNSINILLHSRINAPKPPLHLQSRPRLLNLINRNKNKKLILISSPAGYGKTTLVLDYLQSASINYAWINVSENIDHVYPFFYTIIQALKKLNPSFGEDSLNLLNSHLENNKFNTKVKEAITDIAVTLGNECSILFENRTALVLDDYHHIEGTEHKDYLLDSLIKTLPPVMQVIITSRQIPDFDTMYFLENDMMLKIEMEDLIFSNAETSELLKSKYKFSNPDKITELTGKLGGWITGLHMITQGYGEDLDIAEIEKQPIPENIFNFLAEKTFSKLDNSTKELLLITSVIENFHSELCINYLGISNFEQIMKKLLENHTFILTIPISYSDGTSIISYSYLALFRNYMQSKLLAAKSAEEIRKIYKKTYNYYYEKNDIIASINYLIKAEEYDEASEMINENFKEMFSEGKIEFLWIWLNALPEEHIDNNINSLINLGILKKFFEGDLNTSLEYFNKALKQAGEKKNYSLLVKASINRAIVMQNLGHTAEVINELSVLSGDPALGEYKDSLAYYLAYALFHSSRYQLAEELLIKIENEQISSSDVSLLFSSRKLLGHINLIRGNYVKAAVFYEKAIDNDKNVISRFEVFCNLTLLSSQAAEYSKAEKYLSELEGMIGRFPAVMLKIPYLLAKQAYLYESGKYSSAVNVMKKIYEESLSLNHKQYIYLSSRLLSECHYYNNEPEEAKKFFAVSKEFLDANNQLKNIELGVFKALLFEISPTEKEKIFKEAYSYYETNSLLYNLALVSFHLADFYFESRKYDEVKPYLKLSLEISEQNGYNSFLIREFKKNNELLNSDLTNLEAEDNSVKDFLLKIKSKAI